jgi:hypothetical protein
MSTIPRSFAPVCLSVVLTVTLLAQVPVLNVKMGLWEITSTTDVGGQMPAIDTSKMTPEQKARMEAAMKGMMGAHANVAKTCMTKEKFEKSAFMVTDQPGTTCTQTITANTRTALEASATCVGTRAMTALMHFDALSPTSMKGVVKTSNTEQGRTMTMNTAMTGKWLSADCGDVK